MSILYSTLNQSVQILQMVSLLLLDERPYLSELFRLEADGRLAQLPVHLTNRHVELWIHLLKVELVFLQQHLKHRLEPAIPLLEDAAALGLLLLFNQLQRQLFRLELLRSNGIINPLSLFGETPHRKLLLLLLSRLLVESYLLSLFFQVDQTQPCYCADKLIVLQIPPIPHCGSRHELFYLSKVSLNLSNLAVQRNETLQSLFLRLLLLIFLLLF